MKQKALLLLGTVLLTMACLGTPQPTALPIINSAATPESVPSATPQATALPEPLGKLKIAYILDGNVWLWDGGAPARQLTSEGDATQVKIADDGLVIAYQRRQSLWAINTDISSPRLLVNIPSFANPPHTLVEKSALLLGRFDFQPDTHWIYFSTAWPSRGYNVSSADLNRVDADNPIPQTLMSEGAGDFLFSPNGHLLSITKLSEIEMRDVKSWHRVTSLGLQTTPKVADVIQVCWASDSKGFYVFLMRTNMDEMHEYYFVSSDGSGASRLAWGYGSRERISQPYLSPDGTKVAHVVQNGTTYELQVLNLSTKENKLITSYSGAPLLVPVGWTPDSKLVIFYNSHPLFLQIAGIGYPPTQLTESVTPNSLRWISADRFIFFREGNLLIGQINNPETILIASGFSNQADTKEYDFVVSP
ncbi:MAG: hypothetical protein ACOYZ6_04930 [Chloroflexota bacterium]